MFTSTINVEKCFRLSAGLHNKLGVWSVASIDGGESQNVAWVLHVIVSRTLSSVYTLYTMHLQLPLVQIMVFNVNNRVTGIYVESAPRTKL